MLILKLAPCYRRNYILDVYQIVYHERIKRKKGGMIRKPTQYSRRETRVPWARVISVGVLENVWVMDVF